MWWLVPIRLLGQGREARASTLRGMYRCGGLFLSGRSARGGRGEEEDGIGSGRTSWSRPLCGGVVGLCVRARACVATTREKQIVWCASRCA
jgi:hypothetical protein